MNSNAARISSAARRSEGAFIATRAGAGTAGASRSGSTRAVDDGVMSVSSFVGCSGEGGSSSSGSTSEVVARRSVGPLFQAWRTLR